MVRSTKTGIGDGQFTNITINENMKKVYLYCDPRSLNEATNYYNGIVKEGLKRAIGDFEFIVVNSLREIKNPDIIYTITNHFFFKSKLRFPFTKNICWFQGLGYEEAKMNRPKWKWPLFIIEEWFSTHFADHIFFVSEMMRDYYIHYYGYKGNNHTIMPCYNLRQSDYFSLRQYDNPTFVYAGGLMKWQSIESILDVYALVEKSIPKASLTLYCKKTPELDCMIKERGIKNVKVLYVAIDKLQEELHKYKYGFILREKNWVNLVATPPKVNSYLASYIIPIFSDGVDDFVKNINLGEFTLCAQTPLKAQEIAKSIIEFEDHPRQYSSYKKIVEHIFYQHYNDSEYIDIIGKDVFRSLKIQGNKVCN